MNKQGLIEKLESLSIVKSGESTYDEGFYDGVYASIESAKQLDEPQKPVVPQFVADYIEYYKGGGATLFEMMDSSKDKVYTWLFGNPRIETENARQLLFAQAWLDGYEVEQEPLYYVYFPEITASAGIEEAYLMKTRNGVELADNNDFDDMKFTEQEIKTIDERYWAFAVPVEEVAEKHGI